MVSFLKAALFTLVCAIQCQAVVLTSDSIATIQASVHEKKKSPKTCCVFLDLDETIALRVFDPALTKYWGSKVLFRPFQLGFFDRLHLVQKLLPMEKNTIAILTDLQTQNIPFFIITARPIALAEHTKNQLATIGLHMNKHPSLTAHAISHTAHYHEGIIYCDNTEKGPLLLSFLRKNNLTPDVVIFADNRRDHVLSVDKTLTAAGVECVAFHYTKEKSLPYFSSFSAYFSPAKTA